MKITEQPSRFDHLEKMSVSELLQHINEEDYHVAESVRKAIPQIQVLVEAIEKRMKKGGRLFYIGAGTSGRLGVLDASELPPTFGVPDTWVTGIIAGGDKALRHAVENAEDISEQGWLDLQTYHPTINDTVLGIADCRPRIRNRIKQNEEWYSSKDGLEYDFYYIDDTLRTHFGKSDG